MRGQAEFTIPEVARVGGTRIALGVGLGLMLANRMTRTERRAVGTTLFVCGLFSAGLMALELFGKPRARSMTFGQPETDVTPSEARFNQRSSVGVP